MKLLLLLSAVWLNFFACGSAKAQAMTGNELQSKCKRATEGTEEQQARSWSAGLCAGYISAAEDSQTMWEAFEHVEKRYPLLHYCMPDRATNGQVIQIVIKFLDNHPERLHEPALILILEALHTAFPCSK